MTAPSFDDFGELPAATFGGSGIPNDHVAIRTITDTSDDVTITLGLTAHGRYSYSQWYGQDGYFYVERGTFGGTLPDANYARWNFDWYVEFSKDPAGAYAVELLYDFDPGADTAETDLGSLGFLAYTSSGDTQFQNSWNNGMGFLGVDSANAGWYTQKPNASFDPVAEGEYTFALKVWKNPVFNTDGSGNYVSLKSGTALGDPVAIKVNAVPEPGTWTALLGLAAIGGVFWRRRRR